MERCHYHTRGGCGGKNTGGAASPLKGPEFLLGWGKLKRHRCVKFSRRTAGAPAAAGSDAAAAIVEKVTATKEQAKVVSLRKSSTSHRVLRMIGLDGCVLSTILLFLRCWVWFIVLFWFWRNLDGNGRMRVGEGQKRSSLPNAVNDGSRPAASSEKGGSSSGSEGAAWPRIEIALTSQEKEEDFMAFKGTKPSLRPKKRAKPIQKNVNRAKGLRAMGSKDSDSE